MPIPHLDLDDGTRVPRLGLGTWRMGERAAERRQEVGALQAGLDAGMTLIDTAEMYGEGGAEKVVGEAIRGRRDSVFVVSKFYPHHASRRALEQACEGSLSRLRIEALDLYLLHWRGSVPLAETVETLERLVARGKVRRWGVSNFDVADMKALAALPAGGRVAANQVIYSLARRGIEFDLLPWCEGRRIAVMAYSPLDQGSLAGHRELGRIARSVGATASQLAIAWSLRHPGVLSIPKAARLEHVRANRAAADLEVDRGTLAELDRLFPPPRSKRALEIV
jgi:diketogulonate reductase-like aldo/keto reductase